MAKTANYSAFSKPQVTSKRRTKGEIVSDYSDSAHFALYSARDSRASRSDSLHAAENLPPHDRRIRTPRRSRTGRPDPCPRETEKQSPSEMLSLRRIAEARRRNMSC